MKRSELFFTALLLPIDLAMILMSFYFAFSFRGALAPIYASVPTTEYLKAVLLVSPAFILIFSLTGLYDPKSTRKISTEFGRILIALTAAVAVILALGYIFPNPYLTIPLPDPIFPAKMIPLLGWAASIAFVALGRAVVYLVQKFLYVHDIGVHRAVIVGSGDVSDDLERAIKENARLGYKVSGVFSDLDALRAGYGKIQHVDDVIAADPAMPQTEILELMRFANENHLDFKYVPTLLGLASARAKYSAIGQVAVVELERTPLDGWGRIFKRGFDLSASLLALIILLPALLLVALAVKLTSDGSVLFAHSRVGRGGRVFKVYKFRTMVRDAEALLKSALAANPALKAEWESSYKLKRDPRVTILGNFLRKTSLDELPQLLNVVKGEMSLVGPRPVIKSELTKYGEHKNLLLALKPGLTGLWQTSGRSDISYEDRIKLDVLYIENWSPFLDMVILAKTGLKLLKGAY